MAHRTCRGLDGRFTVVPERQVPVPRPQFILLIEPDDDSRVMVCGIPAHVRVHGPDRRHHGRRIDPRHRRRCHRDRDSRARFANSDMRRGCPSREGAVMPMRTTPEDGDIVVRQETRDGTVVYVLHTAPGPDQYMLTTLEEAVALGARPSNRCDGHSSSCCAPPVGGRCPG